MRQHTDFSWLVNHRGGTAIKSHNAYNTFSLLPSHFTFVRIQPCTKRLSGMYAACHIQVPVTTIKTALSLVLHLFTAINHKHYRTFTGHTHGVLHVEKHGKTGQKARRCAFWSERRRVPCLLAWDCLVFLFCFVSCYRWYAKGLQRGHW